MKTLTLLRHAKSGDDGLFARDFDRRLNAKGRAAGEAIGRWLRDQDVAFDAVAASPAVRVRETLAAVADGYGRALDARFDQRLYLASDGDLMDVVQAAPASATRLLVAGHNPGLERLVARLVPAGGRGEVETKYPTAAVAEIELDVDEWGQVADGTGRLVRFTRPRDLDPALGPDQV